MLGHAGIRDFGMKQKEEKLLLQIKPLHPGVF
jgi:hypothetical protein